MSELHNCFFCCKAIYDIVIKEEKESDNVIQNSTSTSLFDRSENNSETVRKTILQISHYLQVPRNMLGKEDNKLQSIKICGECSEISENLGNLCDLLNTTQLKINYYLNLLTDKIISIDEQTDQPQISLSSFQEAFHQKCLTKLAKLNPNPVLLLTKCKNPTIFDEDFPRQPDQQLFTEETDNYSDDDNLNESVDKQLKVVKPSKKFYKRAPIISCEYCPLTFNSCRNKKLHILAVHLKEPVNKPGSHAIKPCEYCGAMISSRNMSKHKKRHVGHTPKKRREGAKKFKYKRCETCKKIFEVGREMREHLRQTKECGDNAKCSNCGKIFSSRGNLQRHMNEACEKGWIQVKLILKTNC